MTPLDLLEEVVGAVVEEHFVDEAALRARVASAIAEGLRARGLSPDPDIEAAASSRWPVN